jgi:hypothetical protein
VLTKDLDKVNADIAKLDTKLDELSDLVLPSFEKKAKKDGDVELLSEDGSESITLKRIDKSKDVEDTTSEETDDESTAADRLFRYVKNTIKGLVAAHKKELAINEKEGVITPSSTAYLIDYYNVVKEKQDKVDEDAVTIMSRLKEILENQNSPFESDEDAKKVTKESKEAEVIELLREFGIEDIDARSIATTLVEDSIGNSGTRSKEIYEWTEVETNASNPEFPRYNTFARFSLPTDEEWGKLRADKETEKDTKEAGESAKEGEGLTSISFTSEGTVETGKAKTGTRTTKDKETGKSVVWALSKVRKVELNPSTYVRVSKTTTLNTIPFDKLHSDVQELADNFDLDKAIPKLTEGEKDFDNSIIDNRGSVKRKTLSPEEKIAEDNKYKKAKQAFYAMNSPARGLIFNKEGKVHKNVRAAMAMSLYSFMNADKFKLTLGPKSDTDIATMYNVTESEVTDDMRKLAREQGMLAKSATDTIGKSVLSLLGISKNEIEGVNKV